MSNISKEEYLELVQKLADDQYGEDDNHLIREEIYDQMGSWKTSKTHIVNKDGSIDLMEASKDKVKETLINYKYANLKIGDFLLRINNYRGDPQEKNESVTFDVTVYQTVYRTPSGAPCTMLNKHDILKDSRFENRPWLQYFTRMGHGVKIPLETMLDIVRWMQVIKKLTVFL